MKIELPEAYALMPIYHYDKLLGNLLVKNVRVVGYAVSKCYVSEEKINYNEDGTIKKEYRVLFPFVDVFINDKEWIDMRNKYKGYLNEKIVDSIYDDYTSAKEVATERNKLLYDKEIRKARNKDKFRKRYNFDLDYVERNSVRKLVKERKNS